MVKATFHVWVQGMNWVRHLPAESETIEGAAANAADTFARTEECKAGAQIEVYEPVQGHRFTFAYARSFRCLARHPWEPVPAPNPGDFFEPFKGVTLDAGEAVEFARYRKDKGRVSRAVTLCITILEKVLESYVGGYLATTAVDRVRSDVYGARGTGTDLEKACKASALYGDALREIAKGETKRENVREAARVALKELRGLA